jgi:hypothetical protein
MLTDLLTPSQAEEVSAEEAERRLIYFQGKLDEELKKSEGLWRFREIDSPEEISRQIEERKRQYGLKKVAFPEIDPFDKHSRFWELTGPEVCKGVAAVKINNPLGVCPSGINLMSGRELEDFSRKYKEYHNGEALRESSLDKKEREILRAVIEEYGNEDAYEVRALFGADSHNCSSPILILGIVRVIYNEGWKFGLQTQHPCHAPLYKRLMPYITIVGQTKPADPGDKSRTPKRGFVDIFGRPAETLGIVHQTFNERYKRFEPYMERFFQN